MWKVRTFIQIPIYRFIRRSPQLCSARVFRIYNRRRLLDSSSCLFHFVNCGHFANQYYINTDRGDPLYYVYFDGQKALVWHICHGTPLSVLIYSVVSQTSINPKESYVKLGKQMRHFGVEAPKSMLSRNWNHTCLIFYMSHMRGFNWKPKRTNSLIIREL